jgi:hypothetical protein
VNPSIGRIVHYHHMEGTFPAIITKVHNATCVDLQVFGPEGGLLNSVCEGGPNLQHTWSWPPRS